jgi:hypothetical protein
MKICLKELRETGVWLLMIVKAHMIKPESKIDPLLKENNELISIFVKSINTAKKIEEKKHNFAFDIRHSIFNNTYSKYYKLPMS